MKRKRVFIVVSALLICIGLIAWNFIVRDRGLYSKARKAWKEQTIVELSQQIAVPEKIEAEISSLKQKSAKDYQWKNWVSDDIVLMENGDWMAYRNICMKEEGRIPDLVIGRGSDGRWYYSTYHFCIDMIVLKTMMDRPKTLRNFLAAGYFREFDGHSDECLKKTWPN